jgi:hypothetical protein
MTHDALICRLVECSSMGRHKLRCYRNVPQVVESWGTMISQMSSQRQWKRVATTWDMLCSGALKRTRQILYNKKTKDY